MTRFVLLLAGLTAGAALSLDAQEPRLIERLGPVAADSIEWMIVRAENEGLPGAALLAKAREGAGRGVPADRVVRAVTNLAMSLRKARTILGPSRSADELTAGAAALQNGVDPSVLRDLAATGRTPVTVPLVVLTDLRARGIATDSAPQVVTAAWKRGASESELLRFREAVSRDIADGMTPPTAFAKRATTLGADPNRPRPALDP